MTIANIKNYLETLFEGETLDRNLVLAKREIQLTKNMKTDAIKRDKNLINNLNPSKDYCILTIGSLYVPSAVNKLQKIGYKTEIFMPSIKGIFKDIVNYEKIKDELLKGFKQTQNSKKESLVIADKHLMIYSLEGILKKPEELLNNGTKEISICLEHSRLGDENNFLFKKGKHLFNVYDELRSYAKECTKERINLELIGLECREDGVELC